MASHSSHHSPAADSSLTEAPGDDFAVSTAPVIPERNGKHRRETADDLPLPRSYGLETLWLLPRDPHSLFAYWDIDWQAAFGEENPRPREVQLRIRETNTSAATSLRVEPMAGYCSVTVPKADTTYFGEIGFVDGSGLWQLVSKSAAIAVPPETEGPGETAEFATIPLHLSFQQMLDSVAREAVGTNSAPTLLGQLRKNTAGLSSSAPLLTKTLAEVEASARAQTAGTRDLWAQHRLEAILGFGNSSLSAGFGGSSR